jgi:hypothetical protein
VAKHGPLVKIKLNPEDYSEHRWFTEDELNLLLVTPLHATPFSASQNVKIPLVLKDLALGNLDLAPVLHPEGGIGSHLFLFVF